MCNVIVTVTKELFHYRLPLFACVNLDALYTLDDVKYCDFEPLLLLERRHVTACVRMNERMNECVWCARVCGFAHLCFCNWTKLILSDLCYLLSERLFYFHSKNVDAVHCTAHSVHISSSKCNKNKTKKKQQQQHHQQKSQKLTESMMHTNNTFAANWRFSSKIRENLKQEQNTHAQINNAEWKRTKVTLNATTGCVSCWQWTTPILSFSNFRFQFHIFLSFCDYFSPFRLIFVVLISNNRLLEDAIFSNCKFVSIPLSYSNALCLPMRQKFGWNNEANW